MRGLIILLLLVVLSSCNNKENSDLVNKDNLNSISKSGTKSST